MKTILAFSGAAVLITVAFAGAQSPVTERRVAIKEVCAWPNLVTLRDGTLIATIFNQPSHGLVEGDVDCYASRDGLAWTKRGTAASHEPGSNRMNLSAGLAANGDLIVITSGWSLKTGANGKLTYDKVLRPWICRSADGGTTWVIDKDSFPKNLEGSSQFIPFGNIMPGNDGALRTVCYAGDEKTKQHGLWMLRSPDDGKTWTVQSKVSAENNETAILHLGKGVWLAAARSHTSTKQRLDMYRSTDDGATWRAEGQPGEGLQHPAHLTRLKDSRILLTYGNRIPGKFGVLARISADEGKTWAPPVTLVSDLAGFDCGYPATAELSDGRLATAYYSRGAPQCDGYHMGVALWNAPPPPAATAPSP